MQVGEAGDERKSGNGGQGKPSDQDTGSTTGQDELAVQLSDLARTLEQEEDSESTLERVVRAAISLIPGAEEGSISVVANRSEVSSRAPSSDLPVRVDALQAETQQGPCMDAAFEHRTVRVADMKTESRWPEFAARAADAGALSMLSLQLYVEGDNLGALNLYATTPGAFDDESEHVGLLFAAHAAIAYAAVNNRDNMSQALGTREVIGQAQGILMERFKVTGDQAFKLLARVSQDSNRKLRDVASELTRTGELRGVPPRRP